MKTMTAFLLSLFIASPAFANSAQSAVFFAGAVGGVATASSTAMTGEIPDDLEDWEDPGIESTSRLTAQCGILSEIRLVRGSRVNAIFLGLRNRGSDDVRIIADRVRIKFGDGKERFVYTPPEPSFEMRKGWYSWSFLSLPHKTDFKDETAATVFIPVARGEGTPCEIQESFHRNSEVPIDPNTFSETSTTEMSIALETMPRPLGPLGKVIDSSGTSFSFYLGGFKNTTRGFFLEFDRGHFGHLGDHQLFGDAPYTEADVNEFSLGPAFRFLLTDNFTTILNTGISFLYVEGTGNHSGSGDDHSKDVNGAGIFLSSSWAWKYSSVRQGNEIIDFEFALTPFVKYYPFFDNGLNNSTLVGLSFELLRVGR